MQTQFTRWPRTVADPVVRTPFRSVPGGFWAKEAAQTGFLMPTLQAIEAAETGLATPTTTAAAMPPAVSPMLNDFMTVPNACGRSPNAAMPLGSLVLEMKKQ